MQKRLTLKLAAIGLATGIIVPSGFPAYGRDPETSPLSASQMIDRGDAGIADLKAELRLTVDQVGYWPRFEAAYQKIVTDRAKSSAGQKVASDGEVITGRTSNSGRAAEAQAGGELEAAEAPSGVNTMTIRQDRDNLIKERDARNAMSELKTDSARRPDAIESMQQEADALDIRSADLRFISDAARPLYSVLDEHQRQLLMQFIHVDLHENDIDISLGRQRR